VKQEIYKPIFLLFSGLVALILAPFYYLFNIFRKKKVFHEDRIKTVLVTEYHRIGDILMIAPALLALKDRFKNAHIILICSSVAGPLARHLNLVNEVIVFDAPWTNWSFSPLKWIDVFSFARSLRSKKIDLAIDFKGDIRNSWFIWHLKSEHSLGFTTAGGEYFFSKSYEFPFDMHQTKRALHLVSKIGAKFIPNTIKNFVINNYGYIVIHPGTIDHRRGWPIYHWITLIKSMSCNFNLAIVRTKESQDLVDFVKKMDLQIYIFEGNIVQFSKWIQKQRILIAPDSMAGHLASYFRIPVVSLFGSQNPELTKPLGGTVVVLNPRTKCFHKRDHWRLCSACMDALDPTLVQNSVVDLLKHKKK